MELYERLQKVKEIAGSYIKISEALGIKQSMFSYYCNKKSQDNFWPLLPKLLQAFPQISRDWLYFGEGEMLVSDNLNGLDVQDILTKQDHLIKNLLDVHRQLESELLKQKTV